MRNRGFSPPVPTFTAPHGRAAWVEVAIVVEPDPSTRPGDLEWLLEQVVERAERALDGVLDGLPAELDTITITNPQHSPFFPVALGGERFMDIVEVQEAFENLRAGTPLDDSAYDAAGRAFACDLRVTFRRDAAEDRAVSEVWTLDGAISATESPQSTDERGA